MIAIVVSGVGLIVAALIWAVDEIVLGFNASMLLMPEEWSTWLTAPADEALTLQPPPPNHALGIVARGAREFGGEV